MKGRNRKLGRENGGFSLVEVLVAVVILAVITIPLLHCLVTGSKVNAKSKKVLNATNIAQNLMEELKGQELPDSDAELINDGYTKETIAGTGDIIYVKKVKDIAGEAGKFHARIVLDPGISNGVYNANAMADVEGVDLNKDVVYIQASDYEKAAGLMSYSDVIDKLIQEFALAGVSCTAGEVEPAMNRVITLDILKQAGGVNVGTSCNVALSIAYEATVAGTSVSVLNPASASIYKSVQSGDELRNLYLAYEPLYKGASDKIVINNTEEAPVTVYLIKQKGVDGENNENSYRVKVEVKEGTTDMSWASNSDYKAATQIRTNLDEPMTSTYSGMTLSQAAYSYTKGGIPEEEQTRLKDLLSIAEPAGTDASGEHNNLYGVTVEVYLATDRSEADMFDEEWKLVTLDGSRLN